MRFILIVCIFSLFVNCKSPTALLVDKTFIEKYPELSDKSMLSQLEKNRSRALNCYLSNENKNNFIFIEIERYPNGDFSSMKYLSYFNDFDDSVYSCNYSTKPEFIDDSREKTIDSIVSLVKNKKFKEIQELSSDVKNSISDAGIIYITVHKKGKVSEVFKVDEFFIEDESGIPEGFKG